MKDDKWWDESWNPTTGCNNDIISSGCANCYARRMATRLRGRYGYPADDPFRVTFHPDRLADPLKWKKPKRIFACSMGDLFHNDVLFKWMEKIWDVIFDTPHHDYLILTKRPDRIRSFYDHMNLIGRKSDYPNIWLGVTAENQERYDERWPILARIPAAVRFISFEPALSPLKIWTPPDYVLPDLVICGAETGPGARPMKLEWARDLRDQCKEANVPFFFKKAGPKGTETPDDLMIREFPRRDER